MEALFGEPEVCKDLGGTNVYHFLSVAIFSTRYFQITDLKWHFIFALTSYWIITTNWKRKKKKNTFKSFIIVQYTTHLHASSGVWIPKINVWTIFFSLPQWISKFIS